MFSANNRRLAEPAALVDRKDADVVAASVGDVEVRFIERERETIRSLEVVADAGDLARRRIGPIHIARTDFARRAVAFVVAVDAVGRVGEPDGPVGSHDDVVGTVESLTVESIGDDGDGSVVFGSSHSTVAVLATDQPALAVERVPIGEAGRLPEESDAARHLVPAQHAVVGYVAPHDVPAGGDVDRPLRPSASVVQPLDPRVAAALREPLVDDLERGWDRLWLAVHVDAAC